MAAPRRQNKWASQAAQAALLRYAPQREGLAQLTREAREQYDASIKGAQSTSRLAAAAVDQAAPQVGGIYDRAAATTSASQSKLGALLAGLGAAAAPFAAAAGTQAAAGTDKLARERATTESGLAQQKVSAQEAPVFARTLATQQLAKSLAKIFSAEQGINAQQGAAASTELAKLENEAEGRAVTERGQNLTAQSSREGHALTAAGQAQSAQQHAEDLQYRREHPSGSSAAPTVGGVKQLPTAAQNKAASEVARVRELAEVGLRAGHAPGQVRERLTKGTPSVTVEGVKTRGQAPLEPGPLLDAGVEVARYGAISVARVKQLHAHGYSIKALGLPVAKQPTSVQQVAQHLKASLGF